MLKGVFCVKKGKQNTLLRTNIMSKSAFFAEIVFCFLRKGRFFLVFFFCSNPLGGLAQVKYFYIMHVN